MTKNLIVGNEAIRYMDRSFTYCHLWPLMATYGPKVRETIGAFLSLPCLVLRLEDLTFFEFSGILEVQASGICRVSDDSNAVMEYSPVRCKADVHLKSII